MTCRSTHNSQAWTRNGRVMKLKWAFISTIWSPFYYILTILNGGRWGYLSKLTHLLLEWLSPQPNLTTWSTWHIGMHIKRILIRQPASAISSHRLEQSVSLFTAVSGGGRGKRDRTYFVLCPAPSSKVSTLESATALSLVLSCNNIVQKVGSWVGWIKAVD